MNNSPLRPSQVLAAAAEIPDGELLWSKDDGTQTAKYRAGILKQIGRMREQDHCAQDKPLHIPLLGGAVILLRGEPFIKHMVQPFLAHGCVGVPLRLFVQFQHIALG